MTLVLGIDPGSTGALALLNGDAELLWTARTPMLGDDYDLQGMCDLIDRAGTATAQHTGPLYVAVEHVGAARVEGRQQGGSSMFTFGRGYGIWLGMVAACGLPRIDVRPQSWTKVELAGMPKAETPEQRKANAARRAQALWPKIPLKFKRDWAMADAALIARYALLHRINPQKTTTEVPAR